MYGRGSCRVPRMACAHVIRSRLVVRFRDVRASLCSVGVASNVEIARGIREELVDGRSVKLLEVSVVFGQWSDGDCDLRVLRKIPFLKI